MTARRGELLVFAFDGGPAGIEGRLVGALERAESGGAIRVVEVLAVARDLEGEVVATRLRPRGSGGLVAALADVRLDPRRRREATAHALADDGDGALTALADGLEPGTAVAAVMVEHAWAAALAEAVERSGGHEVADTAAAPSADLAREALALVSRPRAAGAGPAAPGC